MGSRIGAILLVIGTFLPGFSHSIVKSLSAFVPSAQAAQTAANIDVHALIPRFDPHLDVVQAPKVFGTGKIWHVGPTEQYKKPSDVVALVHNGDIVAIDATKYACDTSVKWNADNLTLVGVGGRAVLDATGCAIAGDKGIWNPQGINLIVDNIEFMGASGGSNNDAGIRYDGSGYLYITNSYFHHNQNGILVTPAVGSDTNVIIDHSEFAHNGFGDGYTHNIYISAQSTPTNSFVLRFSYSHDAKVGHEVKSRALTNYVLYNRIADEQDGSASYEIDFPQGGLTYIVGNIIQKGRNAQNNSLVAYAEETKLYPIEKLYIASNTFVSDMPSEANAHAAMVVGSGRIQAKMVNNLVANIAQTNLLTGSAAGNVESTNNIVTSNPGFFDQAGHSYYLTAASPAVDAGVDPGSGDGRSLVPFFQYVYPTSGEPRPVAGALDVGANEYMPGQTITPVPVVSFGAENATVNYNTSAKLTWSATNTSYCEASGGWSGQRAASGTYASPLLLSNQAYSLTCVGPGGMAAKQLDVTVNDSSAAAGLGTYVWRDVSHSMFNAVCAAEIKDASGNYVYKDVLGTGPSCESRGTNATGVYDPDTARWYLMGGGGGRNYYGNEIYAFNLATMQSELVTTPTHISQTREYAPTDLYGSLIHITGCNGILHVNSGGIAPAPRGIVGTAAYDPLTKTIIVGPSGLVRGIGNCSTTGVQGQNATDMWSFDPATKTWTLLAPENDDFGATISASWFLDPESGIAYVATNRNGKDRGAYLIDYNATPPKVALVNNVWPFDALQGAIAIDTTNHYALQLSAGTPSIGVFGLKGLSLSKYGTNGKPGTTGTVGSAAPLYQPDSDWKFTGDTSVLSIADVALTYNPKLRKFVAWAGDDRLFFMTPNYQAKTLDILTKHVSENPTPRVGVVGKFTYIPGRDVYVAFTGMDQDMYLLTPP